MKIGVQIPNNSDKPRQIGLTKMGRLAEDAGADSLWVNDHLLMVEGGRSPYPFTPDGAIPWPMDMPWYECLTAASFLAASTSRCRIGTSVLILPQRNALELAKTTATLDALSGGRFVLGIGAGWFAEEIEALGYRFCYLAANAGEVDPDSVRALRPDIAREEPLWAEAVRRGWELYRDVERVSLETRVPLQAVIAILENLRERGELPVEGRESRI